jgi:tRNA modification GTPase
MRTDTIAAISTGLSSGGISIVRISGAQALNIIDKIYKPKSGGKRVSAEKSHTMHYGFIVDEGQVIDEVMVAVMKAPATYTREDIVEIDCHGGIVVTRKVLEAVLKNGARLAEPGEFTKRAFLNGRIDLSKAEAVCDLINAKNELALKNSIRQLNGAVHDKITGLRTEILKSTAYIEAALDDPEHISIDGFDRELMKQVIKWCDSIEKLIRDSANGRFIKEGIKTVILGKPNAGKSSLLNYFSGSERAIVTDIAGTTRDILEESVNLDQIALNIIDTAGIRQTEDTVEKIGVDKAIRIASEADMILLVLDSSTELDDNDRAIFDMIKDKKAILLLNKSDLPAVITEDDIRKLSPQPIISISLKENTGLDRLSEMIKEMFFTGKLDMNEEVYITNERHREALKQALGSLELVRQSIENAMPEDFYTIDLMSAYDSLGAIIGEKAEEDLIDTIFREFCMGK